MLKIIIADDHMLVRTGLTQLLLMEFPSAFFKEVSNADELVKNVTNESWDLVISDIDMPGRSGLNALVEIKKNFPLLPVLILSHHAEDSYAMQAIRAGSSGYLSKQSHPDEVIKAIRCVLYGKKYISPGIVQKLANNLATAGETLPHNRLSPKEFEVMKLTAEGKDADHIALLLSKTMFAVQSCRGRVLTKMGLKTSLDIRKYALENNLL